MPEFRFDDELVIPDANGSAPQKYADLLKKLPKFNGKPKTRKEIIDKFAELAKQDLDLKKPYEEALAEFNRHEMPPVTMNDAVAKAFLHSLIIDGNRLCIRYNDDVTPPLTQIITATNHAKQENRDPNPSQNTQNFVNSIPSQAGLYSKSSNPCAARSAVSGQENGSGHQPQTVVCAS